MDSTAVQDRQVEFGNVTVKLVPWLDEHCENSREHSKIEAATCKQEARYWPGYDPFFQQAYHAYDS